MRIKSIKPIAPELSRCIEVDTPSRLFAAGGTSGKAVLTHNSVSQRNMVFSCIMRPDNWRFLGIDLKRVELSVYRAYSNVVLGIATTLEDAATVLRFAQQTMMKRYTEMEQLGVNNFLDLPNRGQALLVMVDEAGELLGSSGVKALGEETYIPNLNGRRNLGEIEIGDLVFDNHGKVCRVEDKYEPLRQEEFSLVLANAQSISSGHLTKEILRTGGDHYWVVVTPEGTELTLRTSELFENMKLLPGEWKIKRVKGGILGEPQELPVEPTTLGQWLRGEAFVDGLIQEEFGEELAWVPDVYLYSSRGQRQELLKAILGKEKRFVTSDLYQLQGIQRLIASLGLDPFIENLDQNLYSITAREASDFFLIESLTPLEEDSPGKLYCLRVSSPEAQFLCSENFVPTHNTDEGKEQDKLKGEASMIIGSIARLGRAAGVHLIIATQRPDATLIPGETKANLGVRINCGRSDSNASFMILGNGEGTRVRANPRGRLYLSIYGRGDHGQGFFAEQDWIDKWLEAKGLNPDGSPLSKRQSRLAKLTDFDSEFGEGADLDSKEGVDNSAIIEQIRREEEAMALRGDGDDSGAYERVEDEEDWGFGDEEFELDEEDETTPRSIPTTTELDDDDEWEMDDESEDHSESSETSEDEEDEWITEDDFETEDEEEQPQETQEPVKQEAPKERNDGWGGLELGKAKTDANKRPEDDWDDFMDEITEGNYGEEEDL